MLYQVLESPDSFLFFTSTAAYMVLPKRSLASDERIQALRSLIGQKLGTRAKLGKRRGAAGAVH
jgi:hypothetical protein